VVTQGAGAVARGEGAVAVARGGRQGLILAHFRAQLEDIRDTSLTLELNLSTFWTHPRVNVYYMGTK
jgi:hypothetical protein